MRYVVLELAARHSLDPAVLLEDWTERAALKEYLAGCTRKFAELAALHDLEAQYAIGGRCPETIKMMAAGGMRRRPARASAMIHARTTTGDISR